MTPVIQQDFKGWGGQYSCKAFNHLWSRKAVTADLEKGGIKGREKTSRQVLGLFKSN